MKKIIVLSLVFLLVATFATPISFAQSTTSDQQRMEILQRMVEVLGRLIAILEQIKATSSLSGVSTSTTPDSTGNNNSFIGRYFPGGSFGGSNGSQASSQDGGWLEKLPFWGDVLNQFGYSSGRTSDNRNISGIVQEAFDTIFVTPIDSSSSQQQVTRALLEEIVGAEDFEAPLGAHPDDQLRNNIDVSDTNNLPKTGPSPISVGGVESLDWFSQMDKIFARQTTATVYDICTGQTFNVKRTGGNRHADVEPVTTADTKAMEKAAGSWNWGRRPVIVTIGERKFAASMHMMPHAYDNVSGNGVTGHFCIHFKNSQVHKTKKIDLRHQSAVSDALAGICGKGVR